MNKLKFRRGEETFILKTTNYELRGTFADKQATLLLRDLVWRECVNRRYNTPPDEDFIVPYDSDINDMGVTD